jgi:signal transduction histidine kinase
MRRGPLTVGVVALVSAGAVWLAAAADGNVGPALTAALPAIALLQIFASQRMAQAEGTAATPDATPAAPSAPAVPRPSAAPSPAPGFDPDVLLEAQARMLLDLDVARMAHQANNQLLGLRFKVSSLERASDAERPVIVAELEEAGESLEQLVARLQDLGHEASVRRTPTELHDVIESALGTARGRPDVRCCRVESVLQAGAFRCEQPERLGQALINLILNAAEAATPEGHVRVSLEVDGERAQLRVDDDGPGLDPEDHERLCQPFTTTRPNQAGLGLWAARRCLEGMGGSLELGSHELGGLCVTLTVPVRAAAPEPDEREVEGVAS